MKKLYILILLFFSLFYFSQSKVQKDTSYNFYENKGQIVDQKGNQNKEVKYLYISNGLNVQIKKSGFSYDVYETKRKEISTSKNTSNKISQKEKPQFKTTQKFHRVDIDFVNANPNVEILAEGKSLDYDNYYNIPNVPKGAENVHRYRKVSYKNLYPNIDLQFFKPNDTLKPVEYNFIVKPGGKISNIQLKFNGAKTQLKDGKLSMNLRFGEMQENIPNSWVEGVNSKKDIKINFKETGNQTFGFESSQDSFDKTVVIDPTPTRIWGTYYGGDGEDYGFVKTDKDNNVFIYGSTSSSNNIATSGTNQTTFGGGNSDSFVGKLNKNGQRLWGTYYGQNLKDEATSLGFDSNSNIYLGGYITRIETYDVATGPVTKLFILKLNLNGKEIKTIFFGGRFPKIIHDIKIDGTDLYITGESFAPDGISTPDSFQPIKNSPQGYSEGFLSKFDLDLNLVWGTFLGGSDGSTILNKIIKVENNKIYVGGNTRSQKIPMVNPFQATIAGNNDITDGLFLVFSDDGKNLIRSSYLGEENFDYMIDFKILNNILIVACDLNTIPSIYKIDLTQNKIINKTAFNFVSDYSAYIDDFGNTFFSGDTYYNNKNVSTPGAYMTIPGSATVFLMKISSSNIIEWCTYYGGNGGTQLGQITKDSDNFIYYSGLSSRNTTGIATPGTFQQNGSNTSNDSFIAKFADCSSNVNYSFTPTCINNDLKLTASGADTYEWFGPNGFHSFLQNPVIKNAQISDSGEYFVRMMGAQTCGGIFTLNIKIGSPSPPVFDIQNLPNLTGTCNLKLIAPTETDGCGNKTTATTKSPLQYSIPGTYIVVWDYDDGNGNISHQNQNVIISSPALPTANATQEFCATNNPTISNLQITGQNVKWYDESGNALDLNQKLVNGDYFASQNTNGCESDKIKVSVKINVTPLPTADANQQFCSSQSAKIYNLKATGTGLNYYDSTGNSLTNSTLLLDSTSYFVTQTINFCESEKLEIKVSISQNALPANDFSLPICNDTTANTKIEDLTIYQENLITNSSSYIFEYFDKDQVSISDFKNRNLSIGENIFYVKVSTAQGCFKLVKLTLQLNAKPEINLPENAEFCNGLSVELDVRNNPNYTYEWNTGEKTHNIIVNKEGTYSVKVTTEFGCENSASVVVKRSILADILKVEIINNNATVILSATGDFLYSLDNKTFQTANVFKDLNNGNYTVYVKTQQGCIIGEMNFSIFNITNSFSPNGDGKNDTWKIGGLENYPNSEVSVYDSLGKRVFYKITSGSFEWDGKLNDRNLATATYWYIIKVSDGRILNGYLLLKNRN
jgi:gliding motility-associated-like protein